MFYLIHALFIGKAVKLLCDEICFTGLSDVACWLVADSQ